MPHYPVLQPDGRLAVWSTIVDDFTAFDCTQAEAVSILQQWHTGDLAAVTAKVAVGEIPFDHWHDWADCVAWAQFMHGAEDGTVKEAVERTPDAMTRRYIKQFVATCKAETAADDARAALAAATQRADATERELAIWRTAADIAGPNTGALFAERDELRAKLAAVPVEALRRYLRYSQVPDRHHRYDAAEQRADEAAITAWLAQQSEVQP